MSYSLHATKSTPPGVQSQLLISLCVLKCSREPPAAALVAEAGNLRAPDDVRLIGDLGLTVIYRDAVSEAVLAVPGAGRRVLEFGR